MIFVTKIQTTPLNCHTRWCKRARPTRNTTLIPLAVSALLSNYTHKHDHDDGMLLYFSPATDHLPPLKRHPPTQNYIYTKWIGTDKKVGEKKHRNCICSQHILYRGYCVHVCVFFVGGHTHTNVTCNNVAADGCSSTRFFCTSLRCFVAAVCVF